MDICIPIALPPVKADFCAPTFSFGEITKIYLGNEGYPFANWLNKDEWDFRVDNDNTGDAYLKCLHVVGSKPVGETTEIAVSRKRKSYTDKKQTVLFKIDETGDENYDLVCWLEENPTIYSRVWYETKDRIYGGNEGIRAKVTLNDIIPESDEELNYFDGLLEFKGKHPERLLKSTMQNLGFAGISAMGIGSNFVVG